MNRKPWMANSSNMIVVNSIFAAIAGLLIVFVLQDKECFGKVWIWPVALFALSFFLFAFTAERITEAIDEKNTKKHIAHMLLYNFGVIFLFFGMALSIYYKYNDFSFPLFIKVLSYIPLELQNNWWLIVIPAILVTIVWWRQAWWLIILFASLALVFRPQNIWWFPAALISIPWVDDIIWLIFTTNEEFEEYVNELEGTTDPSPNERRIWERIFYKIRREVNCLRNIERFIARLFRRCTKSKYPHNDVYTRLQRSPIHGVGVFAIRDIPKETNIFGNDETEMVWIDIDTTSNIDSELKRLYADFCVVKNNKYGCPKNFNMLTVGWYLNESKDNPNVQCTENYDFVTLRDIKKGEELTANYSTFSERPEST
jgi:hypothetical protein